MESRGRRDVVVVMPVHNESEVLAGVLADVRSIFDRVIVVDDGSTDGSDEIARASGCTTLVHPINLGQGAALVTGITWALRDEQTSSIVTMDSDGQHDPSDALAAVELLESERLHVVLGSRFLGDRNEVPALKRLLLHAGIRYTRVSTGLGFSDTNNGLRALTSEAASKLDLVHMGMAHASEIQRQVAQLGLRWGEVPTSVAYTRYSRSKGQSLWNSVNIVFDLVWR